MGEGKGVFLSLIPNPSRKKKGGLTGLLSLSFGKGRKGEALNKKPFQLGKGFLISIMN